MSVPAALLHTACAALTLEAQRYGDAWQRRPGETEDEHVARCRASIPCIRHGRALLADVERIEGLAADIGEPLTRGAVEVVADIRRAVHLIDPCAPRGCRAPG